MLGRLFGNKRPEKVLFNFTLSRKTLNFLDERIFKGVNRILNIMIDKNKLDSKKSLMNDYFSLLIRDLILLSDYSDIEEDARESLIESVEAFISEAEKFKTILIDNQRNQNYIYLDQFALNIERKIKILKGEKLDQNLN